MKVSLNWLREYVDIDCPTDEYCERMTMTGTKVESVEVLGEDITHVVVGRVSEMRRHENSDHLWVCKVDVGDRVLQIVTGAQNVNEGDLVPVALDGASLPKGVRIKTGKLRGVVSEGMLCSIGELGLTLHDFPYACEDGIFILREECVPGDDIRDVCMLNDTVVDFELTFNRPDCLGFLGIAGESAAALDKTARIPSPPATEGVLPPSLLSVEVKDTDLCSRYCAAVVKNVRIKPSPLWLRSRLRAAGVRPINNIVDITNYVMLEYGQPMHAFDAALIGSGRIIVRRAAEGEKITTLDGTECSLEAGMLVIADGEKPVALAGIMGGANSEISDSTCNVIFESACFDRSSVRTTSRRLNVRSESSRRFEKGLAPSNAMPALCRALELVRLLDAGEPEPGSIDICSADIGARTIPFDHERVNSLLGTSLSYEDMSELLSKVGMTANGNSLIVPAIRSDMVNNADIAEEVVRLYGFEKIEPTLFAGRMTAGGLNERQRFETVLKQTMCARGYSEAYTYSFVSPRSYSKAMIEFDPKDDVVIINPLGEDTSAMRRTAVVSLAESLSRNFSRRVESARLFELATVYKKRDDGLADETKQLVIASYGCGDFYDMKGDIEELFAALRAKCSFSRCTDVPYLHPGMSASVESDGAVIGCFGRVHPDFADNCSLPHEALFAMLDAEKLFAASAEEPSYKPLPQYPAITRDLALICDEDVQAGDIVLKIVSSGNLVESAQAFDVYSGKGVEPGKKSIAFRVVLRSGEKTLSDDEADNAVAKILKRLEREDNITLRS